MPIVILTIIPIISWLSIVLVELNLFRYIDILLITIAVIFFGFIWTYYIKNKRLYIKFNTAQIVLFVLSVAVISIIYFFHAEPFDGGRDPGCYALGAIQLVKTNSLFVDQKNYLTFPCYSSYNGKILPHPSLAFTSYLAILYKYFSFNGIYMANYICLILFLWVAYLIFSKIEKNILGYVIFSMYYLSHYLTMWFVKFTYNEFLFLFFLWFSIYIMLLFIKERKIKYLLLAYIPLSLLPLVRIEGLLYIVSVPMGVLLMSCSVNKFKETVLMFIKSIPILLLLLIPFFLNMVLVYVSTSIAGIILLGSVIKNNVAPNIVESIKSTPEKIEYKNTFEAYMPFFLFNMSIYYHLIIPFVFFIYRFVTRKLNDNLIYVLIALLPGFGFLINPLIATDQPWFMRRFLPSVIPYIFLVFASYISNLIIKGRINKYLIYIACLLLIGMNLFYSSKIILFSENKSFLEQMFLVSKVIPPRSIIFFPDNYSQDDYMASRWATSLQIVYGIETVVNNVNKNYMYPQYLGSHNGIYIISSKNKDISNYFQDSSLMKIKEFDLKLKQLKPSCEILSYIRNENGSLDREKLESECRDIPPTTIDNKIYKMNIYKLLR